MATKQATLIAAAEQRGCFGKASLDEPLFILRAKDSLAPMTVRWWAEEAASQGVHADKVDEAFKLADQMDAWVVQNSSKTPD